MSNFNSFNQIKYFIFLFILDGDVDPDAKLTQMAPEICCKNNLRYSVMLHFVDIVSNKNSYFKLQLIQSISEWRSVSANNYWVFTSSGRIGTTIGITNLKNYSAFEYADNVFKKLYFEKTGNVFGANPFVKQPGKYNQIDIDTESGPLSQQIVENAVPTKLSKPLYELMRLLFDGRPMRSTLLAFCLNIDDLPLGRISKQKIQEAIDLLGEIASMLDAECPDNIRITAASNHFYALFPHDSGLERPPIISTQQMIKEKFALLQNAMEKEYKYDFLIGEMNNEKNLLDVCYEHLQESAEITMLNKSSGMYTQICNYVRNTQLRSTPSNNQLYWFERGSYEVDEVFEVIRSDELMRYSEYEQNFNRQLLFHGSSVQNFVGILTNGLKIAPPEAHIHGSVFGSGIYFADSVTKSANYCHAYGTTTRLVLLCEVAVGRADIRYKHDKSKLISHCESIQAIGQYYPHPLYVRHDGLKIPNGTLIERPEQTGIIFNEFVVFDESRVKIRYLVKLKFIDDNVTDKKDRQLYSTLTSNRFNIGSTAPTNLFPTLASMASNIGSNTPTNPVAKGK